MSARCPICGDLMIIDRNIITGDPELDEPGEWCDECGGVDGHFASCSAVQP